MAVAETAHDTEHDHHEHDHHEHGEFIAHHFDTAEQQYDSGKLGIWVFLVTEVLFFSGLFVAYTLWRSHHPEVFTQAHVFLDKWLGGVNTVVLLFSSLTMAWGVRAAQLGQNRVVAQMTLITMVCASMFIGVKAVEYSHKWDMGILPASMWSYTGAHKAPTGPLAQSLGISDWLVTLSIVPAILLIGFIAGAVVLRLMDKKIWSTFSAGMAVMVLGYFMGAVGGQVYMKVSEGANSHASTSPVVLHASSLRAQDQEQAGQEHAAEQDKVAHEPAKGEAHAGEQHADESHADKEHAGDKHDAEGHAAGNADHGAHGMDPHLPRKEDLSRDVGIFFSIYYCMTGLHAFHIIGGIAFLSWIFYRSLVGHWRPDYFGPVDYVGLYWHLVDLIWIYLFPMLYLID